MKRLGYLTALMTHLLASPVLAQDSPPAAGVPAVPAEPPVLEEVLSTRHGLGNITITPQHRIFVSLHRFHDEPWRVVEIARDGSITPYPNESVSAGDPAGSFALDSVLGLRSDGQGRLWMLDNGGVHRTTPKIVVWNTMQNALDHVYYIPAPAVIDTSALNDLVLDDINQAVYISDPAAGPDAALVVLDTRAGFARRVLQGHISTVPEDIDLVIDGKPTRRKLPDGKIAKHRTGADSIAVDHKGEWVYYGPLSGRTLYRVRTADLLNPALSAKELAARVEVYSAKPLSDGISIDAADNLYLTNMADHAVTVIGGDRQPRTLIQDKRLQWPDAFSYADDGYYYVLTNQLNKTATLNAGVKEARPPYSIYRFKALARGQIGH